MSDSKKLRTLAKWFDIDDAKKGNKGHEVQDDLKRIADKLESIEQQSQKLRERIEYLMKLNPEENQIIETSIGNDCGNLLNKG